MANLRALKTEAREAAEWRGHQMQRWHTEYNAPVGDSRFPAMVYGYTATCKICGAWVQVLQAPMPNQIDIGGPAVAIGCGDSWEE